MFMTTSRSVLLRIRNVSEKCKENRNKPFKPNHVFFFDNRTFYEKMREKIL